jgi:hypothetical protein
LEIQWHGSDFEPHSNSLLVAVLTEIIGRRRSDLADKSQRGEDRGSGPGGDAGSSKLNLIARHAHPLLMPTGGADFFCLPEVKRGADLNQVKAKIEIIRLKA